MIMQASLSLGKYLHKDLPEYLVLAGDIREILIVPFISKEFSRIIKIFLYHIRVFGSNLKRSPEKFEQFSTPKLRPRIV